MATALPVPIEFELPHGWQPASPDEAGAEGAAFVALRRDERPSGFTSRISISTYQPDHASLVDIADESINALGEWSEEATLTNRTKIGTADEPGLTQLVRIRRRTGNTEQELAHCQVFMSVRNADDTGKRVVVQLALTTTKRRLNEMIGEFQQFVNSIS